MSIPEIMNVVSKLESGITRESFIEKYSDTDVSVFDTVDECGVKDGIIEESEIKAFLEKFSDKASKEERTGKKVLEISSYTGIAVCCIGVVATCVGAPLAPFALAAAGILGMGTVTDLVMSRDAKQLDKQ